MSSHAEGVETFPHQIESPVADQIYNDLKQIHQYMDEAAELISVLTQEKLAAQRRASRAEKILTDWYANKIDEEALLKQIEESFGSPGRILFAAQEN